MRCPQKMTSRQNLTIRHLDPPTCRTGYGDTTTRFDTSWFFKLVPTRVSVIDTLRQDEHSRREYRMCNAAKNNGGEI